MCMFLKCSESQCSILFNRIVQQNLRFCCFHNFVKICTSLFRQKRNFLLNLIFVLNFILHVEKPMVHPGYYCISFIANILDWFLVDNNSSPLTKSNNKFGMILLLNAFDFLKISLPQFYTDRYSRMVYITKFVFKRHRSKFSK